MTKYLLSGLSIIALIQAAPAWAQADPNNDNLSDEVISLGSRITPVALDVTTSAASILTENDIQARGQAFLSDILRSLPGLAVSRSGAAGNLTQVRVRGSEANHVLVLIDGVEAGNPNTGEFDFAGIRSEDIIRIEVLRGEQSALWGSDAIGGVINITTRAGADVKSYKASVEVGTSETIEGQISAVIPVGSAALSINGNAFSTNGFDVSGLDGEDDGSDSRSISLGLNRVELGPLKLSALYTASNLRSEFDSDSDFDGRLDNTDNLLITDNRRANITGQFDIGILKNKISLSLTETDTRDPNATFQNDTEGRRLQANWAGEVTLADAHTVTVLTEVEDEDFELFGGVGGFQNQNNNITNYAVAGDYKYAQGPISVTGSVRQDFNDRFDDSTTWRVGGGYAVGALNGRIYGSYGTGVKNPTLTEIFGFFPGSFIGNADIQPETSEGFNIGYRQKFGAETGFGIGSGSVSVDYFQSDLEDEILTIFNPDFTSTVANSAAESSREGVEVQANWAPISQLGLQGALTFLDAEEGDIEEIRRPDFTASASFTWRPIDALSLTGTLDHTGSQTDTDFSTFSNVELDSFTLIGGHIRYSLNDHISLSIRGDNLTDETVEEIVGFNAAGRTVFAGLSANF
ncbi:MAG: TonB-dependent receptor [Maricaulaceae bacterium]